MGRKNRNRNRNLTSNENLMRKAQKRVEAKKGFYWHLIVYTVMLIFFFAMNALTSPGETWFYFPMLPWGIGLAFHAVGVFGVPGLNVLGQDWEKKQLEKEVARLRAFQRSKEEIMLLEEEEEMLNINEKDYLKIKEMKYKNLHDEGEEL